MKRKLTAILASALVLTLLAACGTDEPAATPTPPTPTAEPAATPSPTSELSATPPDIVVQTPTPQREGESRYAAYARAELEDLRGNEYLDDENKIRDTVTMYMDLWYDRMYNPEYTDYSVFEKFFDEAAEGYPHLQYHCTEARYLALMIADDPVAWYDYDIDIESVELEGNTAVAEVRSPFRSLSENYNGMSSGLFSFWITLEKTDGVWFVTDISPDSIYGSDRHGSYDELLESIEELEAEYGSITQMR